MRATTLQRRTEGEAANPMTLKTHPTIDFARLVEKELEEDPRIPKSLKHTIIKRAEMMRVKRTQRAISAR